MWDLLARKISKWKKGYLDLRYEIMREVHISFRGDRLENISSTTVDGYHLRALIDGGFATISFTDPSFFDNAVKKAVETAQTLGKLAVEKTRFKPVRPARAAITLHPKSDPRKIPLEKKVELLQNYNKLALGVRGIQTTELGYYEEFRDKKFVSSEGHNISEELLQCGISGRIIARKKDTIQDIRVAVGGSSEFSRVENREEHFLTRARLASDLLEAEEVTPGIYDVVLNPSMVGVFIHEAFGHFSESDIIETNKPLREKMKLGTMIGAEVLNVVDDPTIKGYPGHYTYDDEGVRARKTWLIKEGKLVGRLHSRRTAASFREPLTGNTVAVAHDRPPIVRMSNIHVLPGELPREKLFSLVKNGLYLCDAKGGQTMGDQFSFACQYGYRIRNGKPAELVRGVNMSGDLFTTLKNVRAVSNELEFSERGGCGKDGQLNINSGKGGPHMVISNVTIG